MWPDKENVLYACDDLTFKWRQDLLWTWHVANGCDCHAKCCRAIQVNTGYIVREFWWRRGVSLCPRGCRAKRRCDGVHNLTERQLEWHWPFRHRLDCLPRPLNSGPSFHSQTHLQHCSGSYTPFRWPFWSCGCLSRFAVLFSVWLDFVSVRTKADSLPVHAESMLHDILPALVLAKH